MMVNSKIKQIDIKNCKQHYFGDIINISNFNPKYIKLDKKSYKCNLIYYIVYEAWNVVKPSAYYFEDNTGPKYLINAR